VVADFRPDLVLLDIEMPGMDGYETCQHLQRDLDGQVLPAVIFISSHDTLNERLKAYESGGMDFIAKPFDPDELLLKAEKVIKLESDRRQLAQEKTSMQQMAMGFLTSMGEMGAVLQFLRNCFTCADYPSLAKMAMETMQQYGLRCHIQIRVPSGTWTFTPEGPASPLEESVLEKVRSLDRIFQFKTRMVINYEHVSVLVNNMPLADPDLCGRIRDNVALIAEGAEASAVAIHRREEAESRAMQLQRVTQRTREALEGLRKQYRLQQNSTSNILNDLAAKMDQMYMSLGLTDGQEEAVDKTVKNAVAEALVLFENGLDFDGQFTAVLDELKKIT
jgi:CheY-like chemotaxis protein